MSWKTAAAGLFTLSLLLAPLGAAHAQEKFVWAKGKVKVKGDSYDPDHAGTENVSVTCFYRVGLLEPDFDEITLRHYCKQAGGGFDVTEGSFTIRPRPDRNYLATGTFEVSNGDSKELQVEGHFRLLLDRKKSGAPKSLTIRRSAAVGTAQLEGEALEIFGKGILDASPVARSDVPDNLKQTETARAKLMACGNFTRNVATLVPGGVILEIVSGCVPDDDTQVLLVQRRATDDLTEGLAAYLEAGGIVVTEFNNADEVFNHVFPETVVQGDELLGDCFDNVQPQVQLSPADPFWQEFQFASIGNASGCGFSLEDFPGVQKLGGWSEQDESVSLAYRKLGEGRVWFLSSDWQDTEPLTDTSVRMMGYMMMHR